MSSGFEGYTLVGEELSENEARDPMAAIYEVQIKIAIIESDIREQQTKLDKHQKRLDFLRSVVRLRMGTKIG